MHHVSDRDFSFLLLVRNDAAAGRDHQNLVAGVGMPPGRSARTEIDDAAAIVARRVVGDDCLPCPCYRASRPSGNRSSLAQRFFRQCVESDDAHDFSPPGRPRVTSSSPRGRLSLVNLTRATYGRYALASRKTSRNSCRLRVVNSTMFASRSLRFVSTISVRLTGPATPMTVRPAGAPERPPVGPARPDSATHHVARVRWRIDAAIAAIISGVVPR